MRISSNLKCTREERGITAAMDSSKEFSERVEFVYRDSDTLDAIVTDWLASNLPGSADEVRDLFNSLRVLSNAYQQAKPLLASLLSAEGIRSSDLSYTTYLIRYKSLSSVQGVFVSQRHFDFTLYTLVYQAQPGLYAVLSDGASKPVKHLDYLSGMPGVQMALVSPTCVQPTLHGVLAELADALYRYSIVTCIRSNSVAAVTDLPIHLLNKAIALRNVPAPFIDG
jgi:hypothetical protein